MVIPNWVKNVPLVPLMNVTGMNTAMNTSVHDTTATDTSLNASRVACTAFSFRLPCIFPVSSFAITASTTTIASSTTVPMASTKAKSVNMFIEKPAMRTMKNVPSSETMIETDGIRVAFQFCRKK